MKIEQLLVHYLLKTKELTLQSIGTFRLNASIPESSDSDKPVVIPENAVSFHYDPRTKEDENLINYIVEHTNKIKPLAASDLDSFLSLGRQFLNIGKPFTLYNLGTLEKTNSGELVFKAGQLIAEKIEPHKLKTEESDITSEEENLFNDYQQPPRSNSLPKIILSLLVLLILAAIIWAVWHFAFSKKNETESMNNTESIVPLTDSSNLLKDSSLASRPQNDSSLGKAVSDTFTFKVVVNQYYTLDAAQARLAKLKTFNRNVIMYTTDSSKYKIAEPFKLPLSDTTRVLDSLKRYYTKVRLEK